MLPHVGGHRLLPASPPDPLAHSEPSPGQGLPLGGGPGVVTSSGSHRRLQTPSLINESGGHESKTVYRPFREQGVGGFLLWNWLTWRWKKADMGRGLQRKLEDEEEKATKKGRGPDQHNKGPCVLFCLGTFVFVGLQPLSPL
jgi:hypothetical protein